MKLLFLTGSRGEWGYIRPLLRLCSRQGIAYRIVVTNMHLLDDFGLSIEEIRRDGFKVSDELYMALDGYNHYTTAKSIGVLLMSFVDVLRREKPDWLILAGDRGEQLAGAVAAAYTYTPAAHIQAGERSGNIDGVVRHAIAKLVHLHFASNEDAVQRLIRLGEEPFRIHNVGAPQLDELVAGYYSNLNALKKKYDFPFDEPFLFVVQHPVTEEFSAADKQTKATLEAVERFHIPKIWILSNNDAGCQMVRSQVLQHRRASTQVFSNLKREDYLGILKLASCIVGNSSSGILEAPTFRVSAVNIGRRQADRVRGRNVIDVAGFEADAIEKAIHKAMSKKFKQGLIRMINPYGDGKSSKRILELLRKTSRDNKLLIKQITY